MNQHQNAFPPVRWFARLDMKFVCEESEIGWFVHLASFQVQFLLETDHTRYQYHGFMRIKKSSNVILLGEYLTSAAWNMKVHNFTRDSVRFQKKKRPSIFDDFWWF